MDNIERIIFLFENWKHNNFLICKSLFSDDIGFRDKFLNSNYGLDKSTKYIEENNLKNYKLTDISDSENTIYFNSSSEFSYNGQLIKEQLHYKISFENNKINKIFEETIDTLTKRIKCVVAYDGSSYYGFQKQKNDKTIQQEIENAIFKVSKEKVNIHSSGRTDAGVHALNQVFHFDTTSKIDSEKWRIVLNSFLPKSILIKDSVRVPQSFHSRYDSISKEYMYIINTLEYTPLNRNYEWFVNGIDIDILRSELKKIIGVHDFRSFAKVSKETNTYREILETSIEVIDNKIKIYIKGTGFLRYMVRNIVGVLVDISTSKTTLDILEVIDKRNRDYAKNTANACGLYLKEVKYF